MKALEFYGQLEEKQEFTELTNTGINTNYKNVFDFAERYAQQRVNEVLDKVTNEVDKINVLSSNNAYKHGFKDSKAEIKDLIEKLKNN